MKAKLDVIAALLNCSEDLEAFGGDFGTAVVACRSFGSAKEGVYAIRDTYQRILRCCRKASWYAIELHLSSGNFGWRHEGGNLALNARTWAVRGSFAEVGRARA